MASIQDIRGVDDPSRAYEWEVEIQTNGAGSEPLVVQRAQNVSIPETTIDTIEIPYKSRTSYYAGRESSGHTVDIEFFDSESHDIYKFFKNWLELISDSKVGGGVNRADYAGTVTITQLKHNSTEPSIKHQLGIAFPTSISDVSLDYSSSEHTTFTVTMSFDWNVIL